MATELIDLQTRDQEVWQKAVNSVHEQLLQTWKWHDSLLFGEPFPFLCTRVGGLIYAPFAFNGRRQWSKEDFCDHWHFSFEPKLTLRKYRVSLPKSYFYSSGSPCGKQRVPFSGYMQQNRIYKKRKGRYKHHPSKEIPEDVIERK